ncbi:MAG: hypothetical protein ACXWAT_08560 [Methylobacter sp.]
MDWLSFGVNCLIGIRLWRLGLFYIETWIMGLDIGGGYYSIFWRDEHDIYVRQTETIIVPDAEKKINAVKQGVVESSSFGFFDQWLCPENVEGLILASWLCLDYGCCESLLHYLKIQEPP